MQRQKTNMCLKHVSNMGNYLCFSLYSGHLIKHYNVYYFKLLVHLVHSVLLSIVSNINTALALTLTTYPTECQKGRSHPTGLQ